MGFIDRQRKRQLQLVGEQFAGQRRQLGSAFRETGRVSRQATKRQAAITGQTGGALAKAQQRSLRDIAREKGDVIAGLGAQEAAVRSGVEQQATGMKFARQERKGSEAFQSEQSKLAREQQAEQFKQTMQFQKDSWADQFSFMKLEFKENLKTNMINGAIALKEAGLRSPDDYAKLADVMGAFYGERAPRISGGEKIRGPLGIDVWKDYEFG